MCYAGDMRKKLKWAWDAIALLVLALAILDVFVFRYTLPQILAGDPFVYWSHVEQTPRAPWMLLLIALFSLWLFLRNVWLPLGWVRWPAALLLLSAGCLLTVVAPLASTTQLARHLQSATSAEHRYHLFYQYDGIGGIGCDVIVVRCDTLGVICRAVQHRDRSPCLGQYETSRFVYRDEKLAITFDNEEIILEE